MTAKNKLTSADEAEGDRVANEVRPYSKLKPAPSEPLADRAEKYGFELSMLVPPEALARVLIMLNDTRGVNSVRLHGMSIVVESTDEVL